MTALICAKCGREIVPGSMVEFVSPLDLDDVRILSSDDALVVHSPECPTDQEGTNR